jgi:hypothetical protein
MPIFGNRLQTLLPKRSWPYPVNPVSPTYPSMVNPLESLSPDYVGQQVGDINSRLGQLGDNDQDVSSPLMNQYMQYLAGYPRPEQYQPGKLDRLTAALSGFSAGWRDPGAGVGIARNILERPYEQAKELYELRGKGLGQAAQLEATQAWRDEQIQVRREAIERQRQADREREDIQRETNKIRAAREKVYEILNQNRGARIESGKDGYLHVIKLDGTDINTGVESRLMAQDAVLQQMHQNRMAEIAAGGEQQRLTEQTRQQGREKIRNMIINSPGHKLPVKVPGGDIMLLDTKTGDMEDTGYESGLLTQQELQDAITARQAKITETVTEKKGGLLGTGLFGTPTKTTVTTPGAPTKPVKTDAQYRDQAIKELQAQKKVVNEQTIKIAIDRIKEFESKK